MSRCNNMIEERRHPERFHATWSREALQLAHVRVDQILSVHHESLFGVEPPAVGEMIGVPFAGATIRIAGFAFCSPSSGRFYAPREGDWILVVGRPTDRNRRLYSSAFKFPIEDKVVQPQPYAAVSSESQPRTVEQLIDELKAIRVEQ